MRKTSMVACAAGAMLTLLVPMSATAQQADGPRMPPPGGRGGGDVAQEDRGGPDMPPPPDQAGLRGGERGGPQGPGMPAGGPRALPGRGQGSSGGPGGMMMPTPFDSQRGYLDLVERFSKLSHDPESAGVAAVIAANELMRPKGDEATIAYFNKLLPQVKNEAVKRAIRIHLIDLYRGSKQPDKALAEVEILVKEAPDK